MRGAGMLAAALVAASSGCGSKPAQIYRQDGSVRSAVIVRSDAETLWVRPTGQREEVAVPRAEVADISHPGMPGLVLGPVMIAGGAATAIWAGVGLADDDSRGGLVPAGIVLLPLLVIGVAAAGVGTGLTISSARSRERSIEAATPPRGAVSVQVGPSGLLVRF